MRRRVFRAGTGKCREKRPGVQAQSAPRVMARDRGIHGASTRMQEPLVHAHELELWVFNDEHTHVPSAVFSAIALATSWISTGQVSGTLTRYPIDTGVWDWCVAKGTFRPKRPEQSSSHFIGNFSSAYQQHHHFEDGVSPDVPVGLPPESAPDHACWIFMGTRNQFPSGVFMHLDSACRWIERHALTGTLAHYPIDVGAQDWCKATGRWHRTCAAKEACAFVQRLKGASLAHVHVEAGHSTQPLPPEPGV